MPAKPPSYRIKRVGRNQYAVVDLTGVDGRRREVCLGRAGSPESRQKYAQILAQYETTGRLPERRVNPFGDVTITQLCDAFWSHAQQQPWSDNWKYELRLCMTVLRELYGSTPARQFGPVALRSVRQAMLTDSPTGKWQARTIQTANRFTRSLLPVFRWGVAHELLPAANLDALRCIEPLRDTSPRTPVSPAPDDAITAIQPHVSRQVWAMIQLQLLTGMRPGEVIRMRAEDIDRSAETWVYRPTTHKTAWRGHHREIILGPKSREILDHWLQVCHTGVLFRPDMAEAERRSHYTAARKTPLSYGNRPGTNRVKEPRRRATESYSVHSYRRAIARACDKIGIPKWHPHQLRHNYATRVRAQWGIEAARAALGHRHMDVTEIYAEQDRSVTTRIAAVMG